MTSIPEPGRLAANVLLDTVIAYDDDASYGLNNAATSAALTALDATGAVIVTISDDTGEEIAAVDASNLVGGAVVTLKYLVGQLAAHTGRSKEEVVFATRQFLIG